MIQATEMGNAKCRMRKSEEVGNIGATEQARFKASTRESRPPLMLSHVEV